jgi:hypothetical protein
MRTCTMGGCDNKYDALGYCSKHYRRFKKHGDPNLVLRLGNPIYKSLDDYFKENTKHVNNGCILWTKSLYKTGYGHVGRTRWSKKYKITTAHRLSYFHYKGDIPEGLQVLHKCDVRNCVNSEHLFLGTHTDNMKDMGQKGRAFQSRGENNPCSKLTKERALFIFNQNGIISARDLALKFNVTHSTIRNIWHKRTNYINENAKNAENSTDD